MKQVTAIVIGAGARGRNYSEYAINFPEALKIVGVAEPRKYYQDKLRKYHKIPDENVFKTWEDVVDRDKFADCVFITTQDQMHKEPAIAFAKKGYHILLEKPMAVTYEDCSDIVEATEKNGVMLSVCHVLRYTPQAQIIKSLIESGAIGDVANIQLLEPVGWYHFAHSFVRGNWRNTKESTFSLLAKSCHDIDLINYWMGDTKCVVVSSMGSLRHFAPNNKPKTATDRCLTCPLQNECPYSAKTIYLGSVEKGHTSWPVNTLTPEPDIESVTEALRTGPYGRCVYDCDNDVMDNQVVTMQFEGGATCTFTMVAFTQKICARQVRVFGTKGELSCDFDTMRVSHFDFSAQETVVHDVTKKMAEVKATTMMGHGGADFFAMRTFVEAVATNQAEKILTGPRDSLRSHFLTFAAERARLEKRVLDV